MATSAPAQSMTGHEKAPEMKKHGSTDNTSDVIDTHHHRQAPPAKYSLIALAGTGLLVGNVWPALGGSILAAIFNGGPPGVLYEFLAVSVGYWTVAASIAELASAMPSSAGVYLWATVVPGPRWGRVLGFFAGWWNYFAWTLGAASMASILSNTAVQMYALNHPRFEPEAWHVYIGYLLSTWLATAAVCLANSAMPHLNTLGMVAIVGGFLVTVIVMAVMPGTDGRGPHASSSFVWSEWQADIGYPDALVFLTGMLNGAYSVGAIDAITHLAEEIPHPSRNVPLALGMQVSIGFVTGFGFLVVILYGINDFEALFNSGYPIAEIYRQATNSTAWATGLLFLIFLCIALTVVGLYITCGRTLWTLARDGATPFSSTLSRIHPKLKMPMVSTLITAIIVSLLGLLFLGSTTAFNAFLGTFILLSSSSYLAAILPSVLTGRKLAAGGYFHMQSTVGRIINGVACVFLVLAIVIFSFPYSLPVTAGSMNYACVIWAGLSLFVGAWWFFGAGKSYKGPLILDGTEY